jgi:hypothetical protein
LLGARILSQHAVKLIARNPFKPGGNFGFD